MPRLLLALLALAVLYAVALALGSDTLLRAAGVALVFAAFTTFFTERGAVDPATVPRAAERARAAAGLPDAGIWLLGAFLLVAGLGLFLDAVALRLGAAVVAGAAGIAIGLVRDRRVATQDREVLPIHRSNALVLVLGSLGLGFALASIALTGVSDAALVESLEALGGGLCALLVRGLRDVRARPVTTVTAQA